MIHAVIDLDGVVYDFNEELANHAAKVNNVSRDVYPPAETWGFFHDVWGWSEEEFWEMYASGVNHGDLLWEGEPLPGAVEGWNRLLDARNVFIHVVTHRTPKGAEENAYDATRYWLAMHGFLYDELSVTDKDKTVLIDEVNNDNPVATIDDRDVNYLKYEEAGYQNYLFDQPWNRHVRDASRVTSLDEFANKILDN